MQTRRLSISPEVKRLCSNFAAPLLSRIQETVHAREPRPKSVAVLAATKREMSGWAHSQRLPEDAITKYCLLLDEHWRAVQAKVVAEDKAAAKLRSEEKLLALSNHRSAQSQSYRTAQKQREREFMKETSHMQVCAVALLASPTAHTCAFRLHRWLKARPDSPGVQRGTHAALPACRDSLFAAMPAPVGSRKPHQFCNLSSETASRVCISDKGLGTRILFAIRMCFFRVFS